MICVDAGGGCPLRQGISAEYVRFKTGRLNTDSKPSAVLNCGFGVVSEREYIPELTFRFLNERADKPGTVDETYAARHNILGGVQNGS